MEETVSVIPKGDKLNIGSGQRRFDTAHGWINVDCVSRPPDQIPDLLCDVGKEALPYPSESMETVVLHQVAEHFGLGEADSLFRECNRVLKNDGSLILTMPDMRSLAERWLSYQIEDYIYSVNIYGAYMGEEGDRHKWNTSFTGWVQILQNASPWSRIIPFNWRPIEGASICRDWWIMGMEAIK